MAEIRNEVFLPDGALVEVTIPSEANDGTGVRIDYDNGEEVGREDVEVPIVPEREPTATELRAKVDALTEKLVEKAVISHKDATDIGAAVAAVMEAEPVPRTEKK